MKKLSVIMPVYNCEKYLSEAIQSVLSQNYLNVELIIVNDGSTDRSVDIIENFKCKDDRIVLINQENKGGQTARNNAIDIATGDYIAFADGDDIVAPNAYRQAICLIEETSSDVCAFSFTRNINELDVSEELYKEDALIKKEGVTEFIFGVGDYATFAGGGRTLEQGI